MWVASGTAAPQRDVVTTSSGQQLRIEPVATNLRTIWDMVWAPDGDMWVTERGGRVSRIDVAPAASRRSVRSTFSNEGRAA